MSDNVNLSEDKLSFECQDKSTSEILCDICMHGLSLDCEANPPCEIYEYLEKQL